MAHSRWMDSLHSVPPEASDFTCPKCNAGYKVNGWDTEYGDPLDGEHEVTCDCGHVFVVHVQVKTVFFVEPLK